MRFIHAADLRIDSPLRGLDRYEGAPVARLRTVTRVVLERLVDMAIAERVDFVLFASDIYDRDWQAFQTGVFFRETMVRLARTDIRVFIVQGILRALARFAEGGQVMLFTHHRHLSDVARGALPDQALAVHSF